MSKHHEESGGDDQSEDGQLRTPEDEISNVDEEGDTADSLDIKPPQATVREVRYKDKKPKEKKHSRERRHKDREGHYQGGDRDRDDINKRHRHRDRDREQRFNEGPRKIEREIRYDYRDPQMHFRPGQKERSHEKVRDHKERSRDRRKEIVENNSEADKILEDLRSRLLSKRNKYESEKRPDERSSGVGGAMLEYESRRMEKESSRYDYESRRDKEQVVEMMKKEQYHHRESRDIHRNKHTVEIVDSPEHFSDGGQPVTHHKVSSHRERNTMTAEEREQAARRQKWIEADREMARRKEVAREELEARRIMRREREESGRDSQSPPPIENRKRKKTVECINNLAGSGNIIEKNKKKKDEIVTVSDNSEEDGEEDDTDSESSSTESDEDDEDEEIKDDSDGELMPISSPLSIGELSKTEIRDRRDRKTRSMSRTTSRSRSRSRKGSKSRSRSTSKSLSPQSRSQSLSPRLQSRSKSKTPYDDDDHIDEIELISNKNDKTKEEEVKENIVEEEKEEDALPPYYPAIQGCRSVEEFQCLNRIEEGTYGVVYRAKDKRTEEIVALKRLKMEKEKEGFPITSLREINTLLKGQHPNIVTVREIVVGSNMDKIFIVMDYVEHDLKSLMETMKQKKQVFLPGEVKCLLQQLLRAVAHLHDNWILHRDLKTSNLLLSHKGILKVGDFGLAREYGSPLKPYTSIVVTLWYRAPELLLCCKEYSIPIDIWSVGCIYAEFLAMTALFPGKSEIDQLNRIFKELGTPNERIWPGYNELPAVQKMTFTEYPVSNLRKRFAHLTSELGLSLLQGLLTYDPKQRLSAELALKSNYFKELPLPIDPAMFPTWPAKSELGSWKPSASPKPPSGGTEFKKLGDDNDPRWGTTAIMESRQLAMGPGFSLKF